MNDLTPAERRGRLRSEIKLTTALLDYYCTMQRVDQDKDVYVLRQLKSIQGNYLAPDVISTLFIKVSGSDYFDATLIDCTQLDKGSAHLAARAASKKLGCAVVAITRYDAIYLTRLICTTMLSGLVALLDE